MEIYITKNNNTDFKIVNCKESKRASNILKDYLKKITNVDFEIYNKKIKNSNLILFKKSKKYDLQGFYYSLKKVDNNYFLEFLAENEQSFVYAVYDFLERIVGCRYYTSKVEYVPREENLLINLDTYSFIPKIDYREIFYKDFENKEFSEKHKAAQSGKHEGWGFWCHSFQNLLPQDLFEQHPEYFALIDGERNKKGEPCLSNPNVRKIMKDNLRKFMEEKADCRYWSVSQNDDNLYCQCENCKKIDDYDESPMGSVLNFVNDVANEFPDKVISTLSYWYTRKPPKHTRPNKNVHIMTCNIEANRGLPIETDISCKESKEELEFWASISNSVSLWDYNIQFRNLVSPFPNLCTLAPNMQFFEKNKVKLLFSQCNREIGGEWCYLRGYLLAKLAWNPYCDIEKHMTEFCNGYYGKAGEYILQYINKMHNAHKEKNVRLDIFGNPEDYKKTFLTKKLYLEYIELFEKAKESVKDNEEILLRVEEAQLPLYYAGIYLKYGTKKQQIDNIIKFATIARKTELHMVEEWKITVDNFVTDALVSLN